MQITAGNLQTLDVEKLLQNMDESLSSAGQGEHHHNVSADYHFDGPIVYATHCRSTRRSLRITLSTLATAPCFSLFPVICI
jgi:hypothetical protein